LILVPSSRLRLQHHDNIRFINNSAFPVLTPSNVGKTVDRRLALTPLTELRQEHRCACYSAYKSISNINESVTIIIKELHFSRYPISTEWIRDRRYHPRVMWNQRPVASRGADLRGMSGGRQRTEVKKVVAFEDVDNAHGSHVDISIECEILPKEIAIELSAIWGTSIVNVHYLLRWGSQHGHDVLKDG
jgi:hypothetical protein